jgi:hypothetical protein
MMKPSSRNLSAQASDGDAVSNTAPTTFDQLLLEVSKIECQERRRQTESYLEVVVAAAEIEALLALLQAYFGAPLKPKGQKPSQEASAYAEPYGGIYEGQTLYCSDKGTGPELAFIWPWGCGTLSTVKVIRG